MNIWISGTRVKFSMLAAVARTLIRAVTSSHLQSTPLAVASKESP